MKLSILEILTHCSPELFGYSIVTGETLSAREYPGLAHHLVPHRKGKVSLFYHSPVRRSGRRTDSSRRSKRDVRSFMPCACPTQTNTLGLGQKPSTNMSQTLGNHNDVEQKTLKNTGEIWSQSANDLESK
eukprot:381261-Amphidinium_carterae.1